jgi:hypothetical protein
MPVFNFDGYSIIVRHPGIQNTGDFKMTNPYFYEQPIYTYIASSLHLEPANLRLFPTISSLPEDDHVLFNLFDLIPNASFLINENAPRFSDTYETLLQSQPDSFTTTIAKKNFENPSYWLPPDLPRELPKIPIYTPTSANISDSIMQGASLDFELDSSKYPSFTDVLYPSFPNFIVNQSFRLFNQIAKDNRFIFKLHFDNIVNLPIRARGWFSQGAFTQAFQSGGKGWVTGPGTVTWDNLFGENGVLKFIYNGILAVSGIKLELQSFGQYDDTMLPKSIETFSVWPFYADVENMVQNYVINKDGSITITSQVSSSNVLLLAMTSVSIKSLLGYSA